MNLSEVSLLQVNVSVTASQQKYYCALLSGMNPVIGYYLTFFTLQQYIF